MQKISAHEVAMEHWDWHKRFLKEVCGVSDEDLQKFGRIAIDYFVHGWKHGEQAKKSELE